MNLTAKQKRFLKSLGHSLSPVVQVNELGAGVLKEIDAQLQIHELIKVRFAIDERAERLAAIEGIASESGADIVQHIGKVALFFRPNPDLHEAITLPRT